MTRDKSKVRIINPKKLHPGEAATFLEAGFSLGEFREAGYSPKELVDSGCNVRDVIIAFGISRQWDQELALLSRKEGASQKSSADPTDTSLESLFKQGYTITDMVALRAISAPRSRGGRGLSDGEAQKFIETGFPVGQFRDAGYSPTELVDSGCNIRDIASAYGHYAYWVPELAQLGAGGLFAKNGPGLPKISAQNPLSQLRAQGFTITDMVSMELITPPITSQQRQLTR